MCYHKYEFLMLIVKSSIDTMKRYRDSNEIKKAAAKFEAAFVILENIGC